MSVYRCIFHLYIDIYVSGIYLLYVYCACSYCKPKPIEMGFQLDPVLCIPWYCKTSVNFLVMPAICTDKTGAVQPQRVLTGLGGVQMAERETTSAFQPLLTSYYDPSFSGRECRRITTPRLESNFLDSGLGVCKSAGRAGCGGGGQIYLCFVVRDLREEQRHHVNDPSCRHKNRAADRSHDQYGVDRYSLLCVDDIWQVFFKTFKSYVHLCAYFTVPLVWFLGTAGR